MIKQMIKKYGRIAILAVIRHLDTVGEECELSRKGVLKLYGLAVLLTPVFFAMIWVMCAFVYVFEYSVR